MSWCTEGRYYNPICNIKTAFGYLCAEIKEPRYFNYHYEEGIEYYKDFYKNAGKQKYILDVSPIYMLFEEVPKRIFETLGKDVKFIFMLRNPVDRAHSAYWQQRLGTHEKYKTIEKAIEQEIPRMQKDQDFKRAILLFVKGILCFTDKKVPDVFSNRQYAFHYF